MAAAVRKRGGGKKTWAAAVRRKAALRSEKDKQSLTLIAPFLFFLIKPKKTYCINM